MAEKGNKRTKKVVFSKKQESFLDVWGENKNLKIISKQKIRWPNPESKKFKVVALKEKTVKHLRGV